MSDWQNAESLPELKDFFASIPPEMKTQTPPPFKESKQVQKQSDDNKHKIILAILCFLIGIFGVHRFYISIVDFTNKNTSKGVLHLFMGLLQLLTLGGLGIWTIVDLILILTNTLKPKTV